MGVPDPLALLFLPSGQEQFTLPGRQAVRAPILMCDAADRSAPPMAFVPSPLAARKLGCRCRLRALHQPQHRHAHCRCQRRHGAAPAPAAVERMQAPGAATGSVALRLSCSRQLSCQADRIQLRGPNRSEGMEFSFEHQTYGLAATPCVAGGAARHTAASQEGAAQPRRIHRPFDRLVQLLGGGDVRLVRLHCDGVAAPGPGRQ